MTRAEEVRLGLVGLGYQGTDLLRVLVPGSTWTGSASAASSDLSGWRHALRARAQRRFQTVLDDGALDAVVIATPVISHVELCTRSSSRASTTFVEKPLATSSAIADELIQLAAVKGRAPMCGHTFVYSPAVRAMKRMLEQRVLGHVYFVASSRVNVALHNAT